MVHGTKVQGYESDIDPNEHELVLIVYAQSADSTAILKILNDTAMSIAAAINPPEMKHEVVLQTDTHHIHPLVAPNDNSTKPN